MDKRINNKTGNIDNIRDINDNKIITDPYGSWTGVPTEDPMSLPIQDVDDL